MGAAERRHRMRGSLNRVSKLSRRTVDFVDFANARTVSCASNTGRLIVAQHLGRFTGYSDFTKLTVASLFAVYT